MAPRNNLAFRTARPAYHNVRELLGSYDGASWRGAVIERIANELDAEGRITPADFVAILGDVAKGVRGGRY